MTNRKRWFHANVTPSDPESYVLGCPFAERDFLNCWEIYETEQAASILSQKVPDSDFTEIFKPAEETTFRDVLGLFEKRITWLILILLIVSVFGLQVMTKNWEMVLNTVVSLVVGMFGSILASQVYASLDENRARAKLKQLGRLAPAEYLQSWSSEMEDFQGKHCTDYHVRVKLTPIDGQPSILQCRIQYSYRRAVPSGERKFTFRRLRKTHEARSPDHTPTYLKDLFDWESDERNFPAGFDPLPFYGVESFALNDSPHSVIPLSNGSDCVAFTAHLHPAPKHGGQEEALLPKVDFAVRFPIECESVLSIMCEFPTKNMSVELDFDAVQSVIGSPHAQLYFTNQTKVNKTSDSPSALKYVHKEWVTPKNGVTFVWWRSV
jgi:hypothetical protein